MPAVAGNVPFHVDSLTAPAYDGFTIVPSDSTNFNTMCRAIYVGVSGNVALLTTSGTVLTFLNVLQGQILPVMSCLLYTSPSPRD